MGFDVIYFPPIHPIGYTNRKGRNNSVTCEPGEPGVPYAIGSEWGGNKAIEPSLGTFEDFAWLDTEIQTRRMEITLAFAIHSCPDPPFPRDSPGCVYRHPHGRT